MTIRYKWLRDDSGPEGAVHVRAVIVNGWHYGIVKFGLGTVLLETYRGSRLFGSEGEMEDWLMGALSANEVLTERRRQAAWRLR